MSFHLKIKCLASSKILQKLLSCQCQGVLSCDVSFYAGIPHIIVDKDVIFLRN